MLPILLTSRLKAILGSDFDLVLRAYSSERKGSFRINTLKSNESEVLDEMNQKGIFFEKYESLSGVFIFSNEHDYAIKGTNAFYGGKMYLQSLSSMLPALILQPKK